MAGKPGRSGGKRTGAGRPVETVTIKQGDQWIVRVGNVQQLGTVEQIARGRIEVTLDDGTHIVLFK
jgi:hypothetical protein